MRKNERKKKKEPAGSQAGTPHSEGEVEQSGQLLRVKTIKEGDRQSKTGGKAEFEVVIWQICSLAI